MPGLTPTELSAGAGVIAALVALWEAKKLHLRVRIIWAIWLALGCLFSSYALSFVVQVVHFRGYLKTLAVLGTVSASQTGGLVGCLVVGFLIARRNDLALHDYAWPAAAGYLTYSVCQSFVCFWAGCCFGLPSEGPIAIHVTSGSVPAKLWGPDALIHPVQLYCAAIATVALAFLRWQRSRLLIAV